MSHKNLTINQIDFQQISLQLLYMIETHFHNNNKRLTYKFFFSTKLHDIICFED